MKKKRIVKLVFIAISVIIGSFMFAKNDFTVGIDEMDKVCRRPDERENLFDNSGTYIAGSGCIRYIEKRYKPNFDGYVTTGIPDSCDKLIECDCERAGAGLFKTVENFDKEKLNDVSNQTLSNGWIYSRKWTSSLKPYLWLNENKKDNMFDYLNEEDEKKATFLCMSDTTIVNYVKIVQQFYRMGEYPPSSSVETTFNGVTETVDWANYQQYKIACPDNGKLYNSELRHGRVRISETELYPGQYFYVYVNSQYLKEQFSDKNDEFKKEGNQLNWKWPDGSKWKKCTSGEYKGWYKRKAQVKNKISESNKVRIATKYSYNNWFAQAYQWTCNETWVYKDEEGNEHIKTLSRMMLEDPMEGLQTVDRWINIEVPLKCDVSVNQYIDSVYKPGNQQVYEQLNYISEGEGNWKFQTGHNGARSGWAEDVKKANPVVLENGAKLVYKVEVKNNNPTKKNGQKVPPVYVALKDTLPGVIKNKKNGTITITATNAEGKTVSKTISVTDNTKIEQFDWPLVNSKGNIKIKSKQTIVFTITATVNATTNSTAVYNYEEPAKATAKIIYTSYVNKNKFKMTASNTYPQGECPKAINKSDKQQSQDFFVCKKYNMTIDKYISKVQRSNKGSLEENEYQVVNNNYGVGFRSGRTNAVKASNEVFIENGDIVTYTIALNNGASMSSPYFSPESLSVVLEDTLPKNVEIVGIQAATGIENKTNAPDDDEEIDDETYEPREEEDNIER